MHRFLWTLFCSKFCPAEKNPVSKTLPKAFSGVRTIFCSFSKRVSRLFKNQKVLYCSNGHIDCISTSLSENTWPEVFFSCYKNYWIFRIFFYLMLNISECHSEDFWVFEWTRKKPCWRASQKTLAKRPKMFRSSWNFFEQNAKFLQSMYRKEKKFSRQNLSRKKSGHAKSRWEIVVAKVFAKKYYLFLWKSEKTTKRLIVFQFFAFSKLILWTQRMHLPQFYPRLLEVGLVLHAWFFFNKKRKNVAQYPKNLKKFWILSEKKIFVENVQSKCKFGKPPIVSC